jgi:hypothetical protein
MTFCSSLPPFRIVAFTRPLVQAPPKKGSRPPRDESPGSRGTTLVRSTPETENPAVMAGDGLGPASLLQVRDARVQPRGHPIPSALITAAIPS